MGNGKGKKEKEGGKINGEEGSREGGKGGEEEEG